MQLKTLAPPSHTPVRSPTIRQLCRPSTFFNNQLLSRRVPNSITLPSICFSPVKNRRNRTLIACISSHSHELLEDKFEGSSEDDGNVPTVSSSSTEEVVAEVVASKRQELASQSIWNQMKEIVMFSGPATGLWICGPLMSLISTAVIGRGSSTELAALGRFRKVLNCLFGCLENVGKTTNLSLIIF